MEASEQAKGSWLGMAVRIAFTLGCLAYLAFTIPVQDAVDLPDGAVLRGTLVPWEGAGGRMADPVLGVRIRLKGGEVRTLPPSGLRAAPEASVHLGLLTAIAEVRWGLLGVASLFLGMNQLLLARRWKVLLDAQGIRLAFGSVLRLHFLGVFFNNTMPGQTGGDVMKAYAIAKRVPGRGTAAVVTVFLDRILGLVALVVLAGGVSLLMASRDARFLEAAWVTGGMLAALAAGIAFYLSPLKRRWLPPERVSRIPWAGGVLAEADRATALYRERAGSVLAALAISLANHAGYILCGLEVGRALGIPAEQAGVLHFAVLIPLVSMVGCLPVSVMGFGLGEVAYVEAFGRLGVPESQALALSLLTRFLVIGWGLLGGLAVLLTRREKPQ